MGHNYLKEDSGHCVLVKEIGHKNGQKYKITVVYADKKRYMG